MELSLIRSLMDKPFYENHRGAQCPDKLFSKDVGKIKRVIDVAMSRYNRDITPNEVEALFFSSNPSLTTAQKEDYVSIFKRVRAEKPMGEDVAEEVLSKLFQQVVGEEIANIGFDYVNGSQSTLEPLRNLLEQYSDDFLPNVNIEWDDITVDNLLAQNDLEARWTFNIPTLASRVAGVNDGHLIEVGARPNTGKTSFHASLVAGPNGFAWQGAKCMVLCNEEAFHRVGARYLTAASGVTLQEVVKNKDAAIELYDQIRDNILMKDITGRDMSWVETVVKSYEPDIVILDMGDKFANFSAYARTDEALKANAIYARIIAKEYGCAIFYMSQLSAEAEGKITLNQAMMEGSRTGKAAEADLMVLIAKNPSIEGQDEEDRQRHLNVVKNKLTGWHGIVHCNLEYEIARYVV